VIELLKRWAAKRPDECKIGKFGRWEIGNYSFGFNADSSIYALLINVPGGHVASGQPALDWLLGCVMRAIEAKGLDYEQFHDSRLVKIGQQYSVRIEGQRRINLADRVEALLTAYVEWLEGIE